MGSTLLRLLIVFVIFISPAYALPAQQIYKVASPSVFALYGLDQETSNPVVLGSAVAVTKTILATNCHVAFSGNNLSIYVLGERKAGRLIYNDINTDLCLIEVPDVLLHPATLNDASEVAIGENIYAIGDSDGTKKTMTKGIVSKTLRINEDKDNYDFQIELFIPPSVSGGGLFDGNAELVGIAKAIYKGKKNIKSVIRSDWILNAINKKPIQIDQSDDSDIYNVMLIDIFGEDNIGLYDYNAQCYIHFYGFDESGNIIGTALWSPHQADRIMVFPGVKLINKSFYIFENEVIKKQGEYHLVPVTTYLLLNNTKYQFIGEANPNKLSPFMLAVLNQSLLSLLTNNDGFAVQIKNFNSKANDVTMTFKLRGFKEAMSVYNEECGQLSTP